MKLAQEEDTWQNMEHGIDKNNVLCLFWPWFEFSQMGHAKRRHCCCRAECHAAWRLPWD